MSGTVPEIVARLRDWSSGPIRQVYGPKDCMLYALGLGIGSDPTDPAQLRHVTETGLEAMATQVLVLGSPGYWLMDPALGVDWPRVLVMREDLVIHRAPDPSGQVLGERRVVAIHDKGADRGAIVVSRHELREVGGAALSTSTKTEYCRGLGGFGGPDLPRPERVAFPDRPADVQADWHVPAQAALIYRLSDDMNPLHADPEVARAAGAARPILHGLCTFGIASWLALRGLGLPQAALRRIACDFTAPVFPGDTLCLRLWRQEAGRSVFRVDNAATGRTACDNGLLQTD